MKFFLVCLAFVACSSAALLPTIEPKYVQGQFIHARILKQEQDISPDGQYKYAYETENGISGQESGIGGVQATGGASWTSPEGVPVTLSFTADEEGYKPTGSHVPPVPEHVIRALEYIRTHPAYEDTYNRNYKPVVVAPIQKLVIKPKPLF